MKITPSWCFLMLLLARRRKWQVLFYDGPPLTPSPFGLQMISLRDSLSLFFSFYFSLSLGTRGYWKTSICRTWFIVLSLGKEREELCQSVSRLTSFPKSLYFWCFFSRYIVFLGSLGGHCPSGHILCHSSNIADAKWADNVHQAIVKEVLSSFPAKQNFHRFCVLDSVGPLGVLNIHTSQLCFFSPHKISSPFFASNGLL